MTENGTSTALPSDVYAPERAEDLFAGGGETGALMRSHDWSQTPLGPVENWPQSLKTSVSICLASRFPIVLYWGPEYVVLYNDAYSQILGSKHPWALGQTCRVCWAEIWDTIGPMLDGVLATGEATWSDDLLLMLRRFGYPEECYFSFSFSPVRAENGSMGGVFTAVIETTEKVIGQRRLATLRDLASRAVALKSEREAWQIAADTIAGNPRDLPFAILYKAGEEGLQAVATAGISSNHPLCDAPGRPGSHLFEQAARVMESGEPVEIDVRALGPFAEEIGCGAWQAAPYTAMLCPISALGQGSTGLLLAAVSPAKKVDESYRTFYQLLSRQIATGIADARGYEEERKRAEALAEIAGLRRQASEREAQLRAQAEIERHRLQELVAQAPAAIGVLQGPEHRWGYINDLYVRVTGRKSAADFLGKTVAESMPELAGQGFVELLDHVYQKGEAFTGCEVKVALNRAPGGQPEDAYFNFTYHPMREVSGVVEAILVLAVDVTYQVHARRATQESEERLRAIIETTPECVKVIAPDGTVRHMNSAGLAMIDAESAERVVGKSVFELIAPEDRESYRAFHESICRGEKGSLEFQAVGLQGTRRQMETHAVPLKDADGTIVQLSVTRDISDRKLAERVLREREAEFRGLADAMAQLVWMAHPGGEIYWYNKRWCDYTGARIEDHLGQGWQRVHDPAYLPNVLERWQSSLCTGEPFEMTFPLRGADGTFRPFLTRAVPIRDSAGKIIRWFGTNTDIGSEVKIREELERSQERLEAALAASQQLAAIVESSDDAIVSKDLHGIVTSWNPGAERIFGYSAEEMIGRSITTIIPSELLDDEEHILATMARGERIDHFETYRQTKSGKMIEVALTISPIRDEAGKIVGAAKIARDITQRKQTERALHTSDRLASVGRLAATIAHEINNPLEAVTNLVYLARCNAQDDTTRQFLDHAEQELVRVSMLTKQTLGFYRETKGVVSQRLGDLLPPLITVFASRAGNKKIAIETQIREHPEVQCIPGEIRQLFVNLLNNSIDAVGPHARIQVRVSAAREWKGKGRRGVRMTIADSGPGIPEHVRKQIFEPFFTTKKDVGTGLGLWVCKGIVSKHGGEMRIRSCTRPASSFTAFSVFLPEQAEMASVAAAAVAASGAVEVVALGPAKPPAAAGLMEQVRPIIAKG